MAERAPVEVTPFVDGAHRAGESEKTVMDKYDGTPATRVATSSRDQVEHAIGALGEAWARTRWDPPDRSRVLSRAAGLLADRREEAATTIVADSGFTITDARREVDRATRTLQLCAEESTRIVGQMVPLSGVAGQQERLGFTVRHPIGIVCAITPFNSPLNTVCHKVGPALAAGNAVILKPASQTPRSADMLLHLLLEAGLPPELIAVVYGSGAQVGRWLAEDPRPAFYAFTGSTEVGEDLHRTVGLRRTQLELGSLSSTVICSDAGIERCVELSMNAAFRKAGQVCTSVQRLYVQRPVLEEVTERLTKGLADRIAGDPTDPATFVGPLISPDEAERVATWTADAVERGAGVLAGNSREGSVVAPTVLTDVAPDMTVMCREVFGPVMLLRPFDELAPALAEIDDTPYGLAAGIFTADIGRALDAAQRLRMGSVHINETSSSRVDLMPYTGVKSSGMGTEGPHYAIREMTEERLITLGRP